MDAIIGLLELAGGIIFFFAAGLLFARISGYGEFYDKMLYDEESDAYITFKRYKMDNNINNDEDLIHQFYI